MSEEHDAAVLELAPLPRDQVGPFLLLGLDKDATAEQVEAHWAQRVLWARKGRIRTPLEDVNWAREALRDADQRGVWEAASLNVVLSDGYLLQLAEKFGMEGRPGTVTAPRWQPLQKEEGERLKNEPGPARHSSLVPDPSEEAAAVALPEAPEEFPSVAELLRRAAEEPIDPWSL
jgi:hypothetical protein